MNSIDLLKERMRGRTAEEAIDSLARTGALDHTLARRAIIVEEFEHRYGTTPYCSKRVKEDIAEEFCVSLTTVRRYVDR